MKLSIKNEATHDEIMRVLANMSPQDKAENDALGGNPVESFTVGFDKSPIRGLIVKGSEPVALYGCLPDIESIKHGILWLVCTSEFRVHKRDVMILTDLVVTQMREKFNYLHNIVHKEHSAAINWLRWAGFTVNESNSIGPNKAFYYFHWSKYDV